MEERDAKPLRYTNRWFAYFDLLGFANLIRDNEIEHVLPIYEDVLDTLFQKAELKRGSGIQYSWFSDTFIIFTKGDSDEEFAFIESVSRLFFQRLIMRRIPVRGALTVGLLYSQQRNNIFIGEALIDAHDYGEEQNWLGFLMTPSVYHHLKGSKLCMKQRAFYRPVRPGIITHPKPNNVYAYTFNNGEVNGNNPFLQAVIYMKNQAGKEYEEKYINTEEFIKLYSRARLG